MPNKSRRRAARNAIHPFSIPTRERAHNESFLKSGRQKQFLTLIAQQGYIFEQEIKTVKLSHFTKLCVPLPFSPLSPVSMPARRGMRTLEFFG